MSKDAKEIWEVLKRGAVLEHPFVTVSIEEVRLPNGEVIPDWPTIVGRDYVNAIVLNEAGEVMVLEGYRHGVGSSSWQVLGGYLEDGEDPMTAVKQELLEETGYGTDDWLYLGSFVIDANQYIGVGHFFCARGVQRVAQPNQKDLDAVKVKWVSLRDLRYALLDGRIAVLSYAINIALAMLLVFPPDRYET